jgi:ABC-type multidrug transport system permease subunit
MELLFAFFASLAFVGLKSWQQQNVTHEQYLLIPPTSFAMAFFEVYIIATVARSDGGMELVMAIGAGAGIGSMLATYLHKRMRDASR